MVYSIMRIKTSSKTCSNYQMRVKFHLNFFKKNKNLAIMNRDKNEVKLLKILSSEELVYFFFFHIKKFII